MRDKKNKINLEEMNSKSLTTIADVLGLNSSASSEMPNTDIAVSSDLSVHEVIQSKVRLTSETKGRAGKVITKMVGLSANEEQITDLVRKIKHELGCGASEESNVIFFQGDQRERLAKFLEKLGFKNVKTG